MEWLILDNRYPPSQLSILAGMLSEDNPMSAKEQLDIGYSQYGGWRPMQGFTLQTNRALRYPGDPPLFPWACTHLKDEAILVYPGDWILILQNDDSFEVCRMD